MLPLLFWLKFNFQSIAHYILPKTIKIEDATTMQSSLNTGGTDSSYNEIGRGRFEYFWLEIFVQVLWFPCPGECI